MTMHESRRKLVLGGAAALALGGVGGVPLVRAQARVGNWPEKPVKVIVGFAPGGSTDVYARVYSAWLQSRLGQSFIVENRPGAGSLIACEALAKAAPDGYTLMYTISTSLVQNQLLYAKLPYDPNQFVQIAATQGSTTIVSISSTVPVNSGLEFVEWAKKSRVNFGTYAAGSFPHMICERMNKVYGLKMEAVHYKGEAPMYQDMAAGTVHIASGSYQGLSPLMKGGKAKVLGTLTKVRNRNTPDTPTFFEQGMTDPVFQMKGWGAWVGPPGLPAAIRDRLSQLLQDGWNDEKVRGQMQGLGVFDSLTSAADAEATYREQSPLILSILRELNVKPG
jgi:tripartite-type tricarboxylate transporter receptor subunit TctC